jgi:heat shock protein HslJ
LTLGLNSIDPDPTGFAHLDEAVSAHADVTGKADLMSPSLARITFLAISIAACHPAIGRAQGNVAFWLDDPKPTSWNTPGALILAAPKTQGPIDARCREQARPAQLEEDTREAYLQFQPQGRVSGSDGCNRFTGTYELAGDRVTFGRMAGTKKACLNPGRTEGPFRDALKNASRFAIAGDPLELFDASGTRLATFAAGKQSTTSPTSGLVGTSWQLVQFQGGDDTTLVPNDPAKYTIAFAADGRLTARIDCNRGRGTWKSSRPNQITFGPVALTRAKCPPGSLHDQIVKQWGNIRSYVIKDGHLFLTLMADGGIYEFEPIATPK